MREGHNPAFQDNRIVFSRHGGFGFPSVDQRFYCENALDVGALLRCARDGGWLHLPNSEHKVGQRRARTVIDTELAPALALSETEHNRLVAFLSDRGGEGYHCRDKSDSNYVGIRSLEVWLESITKMTLHLLKAVEKGRVAGSLRSTKSRVALKAQTDNNNGPMARQRAKPQADAMGFDNAAASPVGEASTFLTDGIMLPAIAIGEVVYCKTAVHDAQRCAEDRRLAQRGKVCTRSGDLDEAVRAYEGKLLVEDEGEHARTFFLLGEILSEQKKWIGKCPFVRFHLLVKTCFNPLDYNPANLPAPL